MEVLGGISTVVSLVQNAWQVIEYIKAVAGAEEDRQKLIRELVRATVLLAPLVDVTQDAANEAWSRAVRTLNGPDGPLNDFKALLEEITENIGIKPAPKRVLQNEETAAVLPKSRFARFTSHFYSTSSSGSSTTTPPTKSIEQPEHSLSDHLQPVRTKMNAGVRNLEWPFDQPGLLELLNKLERIKSHFILALSTDNLRLTNLIREDLETVQSKVLVIADDTTAIRQHLEGTTPWTDEQRRLFQSISILNFSSQSQESPEKFEEIKQTAGWILHHPRFRDWRTGGSTLLLSGEPGSGKTSVSKTVEKFLELPGPGSKVFVVAVYFSSKFEAETQTLKAVLAFIVEQMLKVRPELQKYYNKLMLTGEGLLEVTDSLRIIHRAQQEFDHFYIVLDGLDECDSEQAQDIVTRLSGLRNAPSIFATYRPGQLLFPSFDQIPMKRDLILTDIRSCIRNTMAERFPRPLMRALKENPEDFDSTVETIVANSGGIFSLARVQMDLLREAESLADLRDRMSQLQPQSTEQKLEKIYARILQQITELETDDAKLGRRVLGELFAAEEAVREEDLLDAVAKEAGWEVGDRSTIGTRVKRCVDSCSGLVARTEDGKVQFSHVTVRAFLEEGHV